MKKTSKYYIEKRDKLSKKITGNWHKILTYNLIPKTLDRTYDIKALFEEIKSSANQRVQTKMAIQAINMGIKTMKDFPKDNNYINIYWLSELKEIKTKLEEVQRRATIAPSKKKKAGSKITVSEVFSYVYITNLLKNIDNKIVAFENKRNEFNEKAEFDANESIENIFEDTKKSSKAAA